MSLLEALIGRAKRRHTDPLAHAETMRPLFYAMGENCAISPRAIITDPAYVELGNNVRLSDCALFGHDGSVNMINRALGMKLDAVGPIVIEDDVFIGHGAIILPGTFIGPRTIIGAGSVVKGRVDGGHVYGAGRAISSFDDYVEKLIARNESYPWRDLIAQRLGEFDADLEPELVRLRVAHFFGAGVL